MCIAARRTLQLILACVVVAALPRLVSLRLEATEHQSISVGCPADGQAGPIEAGKDSFGTPSTSEVMPKPSRTTEGEWHLERLRRVAGIVTFGMDRAVGLCSSRQILKSS